MLIDDMKRRILVQRGNNDGPCVVDYFEYNPACWDATHLVIFSETEELCGVKKGDLTINHVPPRELLELLILAVTNFP